MVKIENNRLILVFDESYSSYEDIAQFINSILWCIAQINKDSFCQDDLFNLSEMVRMLLPSENQVKYENSINRS